jgi:succinate dehydrogenase / fumarate reductase cytochrome b subunit
MYKVFDNIIQKDSLSSYVTSAKELLKELGLEYGVLEGSKPDIATEGKSLNEEAFLYNCAYNLSLAKGDEIVCVEDSSYTSLNLAKLILLEDSELKSKVVQRLQKDGKELCLDVKVLHINDILRDVVGFDKLASLVKNKFEKFNIAVFNGNKTLNSGTVDSILLSIGANLVNFEASEDSDGYEVLDASEFIADKLAGKVMLDAFDNASDFVVANDARSFYMFDNRQKSLEKVVGRDINLPVYSISQVVLMAIGCTDREKVGVDSHKVATTLI